MLLPTLLIFLDCHQHSCMTYHLGSNTVFDQGESLGEQPLQSFDEANLSSKQGKRRSILLPFKIFLFIVIQIMLLYVHLRLGVLSSPSFAL
jgi:hypothetical protein